MAEGRAGTRAWLVGLTGGIASGKSAAANRFAEHDVPIIDADVIAREVVEPGELGLTRVVDTFGHEILAADGRIDRSLLRQRVFADPEQRRRLESLLHPLIRERMFEKARAATAAYVVLVVPLLVEGGLDQEVDRVLVVDVSVDTQRRRLMARDGSRPDQVDAILAAQADRQYRLDRADDVIDNDGSLSALHRQVDSLHRQYLKLAQGISDSS